MKSLEKYRFLKEKVKAGVWLNDFHLNHNLLDFADKFYPNTPMKRVIQLFNKEMKILVIEGLCTKNSSSYPGIISEFGRRKINTYVPKTQKQ